ncbi:MAG: hypothetical protein R2809_14085 [Flavobacteriales bacterium]
MLLENRAYKASFRIIHNVWILLGCIFISTILIYDLLTNEVTGSFNRVLIGIAVVAAVFAIIQIRHLKWYFGGKEVVEIENDFLLIKYFINRKKPFKTIKLNMYEIVSISLTEDLESRQFISLFLPTNGILLKPEKGRLILKTIYDKSYRISQDASIESILQSELYLYLNGKCS